MKVKIIASVLHLKLSDDYRAIVDNVALVNYDELFVVRIIGENFGKLLGAYGLSKIKKDCAIAFSTYEDNITVTDSKNESELDVASEKTKEYIYQYRHFTVTLDTFLWFVKDNSCILVDILCHADAGKVQGIIPTDYRRIVSNCTGEFAITEYSRLEIERALEIRNKFFEVCHEYIEADEQYIAKTDNMGRPVTDEIVREFNPIERAFSFIRAARNSKDLAPKFAMYMSMFESLFGRETSEVTHRVCERVAFYIGSNREDRLLIYSKMKSSYDIRSKYVHGSRSNEDLRKKTYRLNLLTHLDDYARRVITKVIMEDSEIFTADHKLDKFLKELIFQENN